MGPNYDATPLWLGIGLEPVAFGLGGQTKVGAVWAQLATIFTGATRALEGILDTGAQDLVAQVLWTLVPIIYAPSGVRDRRCPV